MNSELREMKFGLREMNFELREMNFGLRELKFGLREINLSCEVLDSQSHRIKVTCIKLGREVKITQKRSEIFRRGVKISRREVTTVGHRTCE